MKKIFILIFFCGTFLNFLKCNAQLFSEDFKSFADSEDLKKVWTGYGDALAREIYIAREAIVRTPHAAIYVGNWKEGDYFGVMGLLDDVNLTSASSITLLLSAETNRFIQEPATSPTSLRFGFEGSNRDIWESRVSHEIAIGSLSRFTFQISESEMWKTVDRTGSDSLLDALASVSDIRLIFTNTGNSGVQDFVIENITLLP